MRKYRPVLTLLVFAIFLQTTESVAQCTLPTQPALNGPASSCGGDNTSKYVIPAPGSNAEGLTYTYYLSGGGELSVESSPTPPGNTLPAVHLSIAWTQSGNHTLTVTPHNACGTGPAVSMNITVGLENENSIEVEGETILCGTSLSLSVPPHEGYQYQWNLNNSPITGATASSYTAIQSGSYSITITNTASCTFKSNVKDVTINPLPSALITAASATTFCTGGSVLLNASTTLSGFSYQWKLNGVDITNATSSSYTAFNSGDYSLTITNTNSCSATSLPIPVVVNTLPAALVTPASPTVFCSGGSVILNASSGTDLQYQWRTYGTPIPNATNASYTAIETGLYAVTITNSNGCSLSSATVPVTVNSLPQATLTPGGSTTFCTGGNVTLYANTGSGLSYQWMLNGANLPNASNSFYTATQSGDYSVVVSNAANCSRGSALRTVTANPLPTTTITPASTTEICSGGSVLLNTNAGSAIRFQWLLQGEVIVGATSASFLASAPGAYSLIATNAFGCVGTSNVIVVGAALNPPQVSINDGLPSLEVCDEAALTLTAHAVGNNLSYTWLRDGKLVPGANTSTFAMMAAVDESITVRVVAPGNCSAEASVHVQVQNNEELEIIVDNPNVQRLTPYHYLFCEGSSIQLSSSVSGSTFQWKKEGIDIPEASTPTLLVTEPGHYSLAASGTTGCTKSSRTIMLEVAESPTLSLNYGESLIKCVNDFLKLETQNLPSYTYQWLKDGTAFSLGDPGAKHRLTFFTPLAVIDAGKYSVKVTSPMGCETTSPELTLIINTLYPAASIEGERGNLCSLNGIELRANTGVDLAYQWILDGETIPGATTYIYYAKTEGSYAVEVSKDGCSKRSANRHVDVSTPLIVTIDGPESICSQPRVLPPYKRRRVFNVTNNLEHPTSISQTNTMLTARVSTLEGVPISLDGYAVQWNGGSPTNDPLKRTVTSPGDFKVNIIHQQYGCHYSSVKTVRNYSKIKPTIEQSGDVCLDNVVTLTSSLADAYRWSTGARTRSITASPSRSYSVTTINANGGCEATSIPFTVQPCSTSTFQLIDSDDADAASEGSTLISLFPNPADQTITVTVPQTLKEPLRIRIREQLGKIVSETFLWKDAELIQINTSALSNGLYTLELETEKGIWMQKVMVSHRQ